MHLNQILHAMIQSGASDLHLKPGAKPIVRISGELYTLDEKSDRLSETELQETIRSILKPELLEQLERSGDVDLAYHLSQLGRFRINIFRQNGGERMVIRAIPIEIPDLQSLRLPKVIEKIAGFERGLVLVTGTTGSGKSTTLSSMIDWINQNKSRHILTIEDPIEYIIRDKKSLVSQRELGGDAASFASALRAALRQDPDVILIGEIRDYETMETALTAAETGHLVFATLHTSDARETLNRVLFFFEPHEQQRVRQQVATNLKGIISQRLVRPKNQKGLVPAVEILLNTTRVRDMILNADKTMQIQTAIEEGHLSYGMQSFDQSLMQLLKDGTIDYTEALEHASNPDDFALRVKGVVSNESKWNQLDKSKKPK